MLDVIINDGIWPIMAFSPYDIKRFLCRHFSQASISFLWEETNDGFSLWEDINTKLYNSTKGKNKERQ